MHISGRRIFIFRNLENILFWIVKPNNRFIMWQHVFSKTFATTCRPYAKACVDQELKIIVRRALLCLLIHIDVLDGKKKLECILGCRLQTKVLKLGLAPAVHHASVLIRQRHTQVRKQFVSISSIVVRLEWQKHIDYSLKSHFVLVAWRSITLLMVLLQQNNKIKQLLSSSCLYFSEGLEKSFKGLHCFKYVNRNKKY